MDQDFIDLIPLRGISFIQLQEITDLCRTELKAKIIKNKNELIYDNSFYYIYNKQLEEKETIRIQKICEEEYKKYENPNLYPEILNCLNSNKNNNEILARNLVDIFNKYNYGPPRA